MTLVEMREATRADKSHGGRSRSSPFVESLVFPAIRGRLAIWLRPMPSHVSEMRRGRSETT